MSGKTVKSGIYQMTDVEYFASPGISNSMLGQFARSPAHYREYLRNPPETKPEQLVGKALHCLILERDLFDSRFAVLPDNAPAKPTAAMLNAKNPSESSVARIEFWEKFQAQIGDREVLTNEQAVLVNDAAATIRSHPELANLLAGECLFEVAVFAEDPVTGLLCRCKIDLMSEIGERLINCDLKSTRDARPFRFQKSAYDFGYFRQAAFYIDVCRWADIPVDEPFIIPAFETEPPFNVSIFSIEGEQLERGRQAYRNLLHRLAVCEETGQWPGYSTDITPLIYPSWAQD